MPLIGHSKWNRRRSITVTSQAPAPPNQLVIWRSTSGKYVVKPMVHTYSALSFTKREFKDLIDNMTALLEGKEA